MRRKIVAGNWKMNKTSVEAEELSRVVREQTGEITGADIVLCPPFTALAHVSAAVEGSTIALGAQNMHWETKGAYTGEVSANMLLTLKCDYVILGHSERRAYFGEIDEIVARKVKAAIAAGLTPIVCVGETKSQREDGVTEKVVGTQIRGAFEGLTPDEFEGIVVAYEPVWAIGTGLTASTEQAQEVHAYIRAILGEMMGADSAAGTRIQYGGSVKPGNARELFSQPDIDGGLIGGAALDADSFRGIVEAAMPEDK